MTPQPLMGHPSQADMAELEDVLWTKYRAKKPAKRKDCLDTKILGQVTIRDDF